MKYRKGYVSEDTDTNEEVLAAWEDDEWYEALVDLHTDLMGIMPGYKIVQIKSKFGGLRYYIEYPRGANSEQIKAARGRIAQTEQELWEE
jgi:hypothetical protein